LSAARQSPSAVHRSVYQIPIFLCKTAELSQPHRMLFGKLSEDFSGRNHAKSVAF
jgi:hypothetical protein